LFIVALLVTATQPGNTAIMESRPMGDRLDSFLMAAGGAVFVCATAGMLSGREPFATWYYSFAWWSYIVFADAWLHHRTGRSALLRNRQAPQVFALSIVIWLIFEAYNFRLNNWHYLEIPSNLPLRWLGYSVAFATVLPGIFVTAELLETVRQPGSFSGRTIPPGLPGLLLWVGLVGSVIPVLWPTYFFPMVWLGPTGLLAAVNFRLGGSGILTDIRERGPAKLYRLVGAGMVCGLLWECWNFWAGSKWVYNIPFFGGSPLFEMPIAGFLGFPPFAIECHEMYVLGEGLLRRVQYRPVLRLAFWLLLAAWVVLVYLGIDAFTVRSFSSA